MRCKGLHFSLQECVITSRTFTVVYHACKWINKTIQISHFQCPPFSWPAKSVLTQWIVLPVKQEPGVIVSEVTSIAFAMIWMGNDLSLINDWETYLKGIHLQHGLDILLRWTGALERTHVLPVVSACSYASLRDHVRDVAEVPESIPLSPLLPLGNAICSDVDSSPPPVSLSLPSPPSFLFSCV